eukprot:5516922-Heterocapsa_arctica.AAC.1
MKGSMRRVCNVASSCATEARSRRFAKPRAWRYAAAGGGSAAKMSSMVMAAILGLSGGWSAKENRNRDELKQQQGGEMQQTQNTGRSRRHRRGQRLQTPSSRPGRRHRRHRRTQRLQTP